MLWVHLHLVTCYWKCYWCKWLFACSFFPFCAKMRRREKSGTTFLYVSSTHFLCGADFSKNGADFSKNGADFSKNGVDFLKNLVDFFFVRRRLFEPVAVQRPLGSTNSIISRA